MRQGSDALKQVLVANPYHLVASVQNPADGSIPDVPASGASYPGFPSNASPGTMQQIGMAIRCEDDQHNPAPAGSCFFALNLAPGSNNGGHLHMDSPRPLILASQAGALDMPAGGNATNGPLSVDTYGGNLFYTPPEISGDVVLNVTGSDAQGNPLGSAIPITFSVGVPNLQEIPSSAFYRLTGVYPNGSTDPDTQFHPQNHFVSSNGFRAVFLAIAFQEEFQATLGLNDNSLPRGGLFDLDLDWDNASGHNLHRLGNSADIDRCAQSTIPNNDNAQGNCPNGWIKVPRIELGTICGDQFGHMVNEGTYHCEFTEQ